MALNYFCVDAASRFCPCQLAKTDSCLICSLLQGNEVCDCNWQGVCIYQEYVWNRNKIQNRRKSLTAKIVEKEMITKEMLIIKVLMPIKEMIAEYAQPGAYAFLRAIDSPEYYDVPLCIVDVNEEAATLVFAVRIVGPKTKSLAAQNDEVAIRGPYWNGLFGLKYIKSSLNKKWLVIGKGAGQVSLIQVVKNLLRGNNQISMFLDPGVIRINLAEKHLNELGISTSTVNLYSETDRQIIYELLKDSFIDFVFSAGSDKQHKRIKNMIEQSGRHIPLIISNNRKLCCGEGICGSCETLIDGKQVHLCKLQLNGISVLEG
jgi:NAD(P)H-flavin reductase